jgi:hypothetical protein
MLTPLPVRTLCRRDNFYSTGTRTPTPITLTLTIQLLTLHLKDCLPTVRVSEFEGDFNNMLQDQEVVTNEHDAALEWRLSGRRSKQLRKINLFRVKVLLVTCSHAYFLLSLKDLRFSLW